MKNFEQEISISELRSYQLSALNRQIQYARENSSFWRKSLSDAKLPFLSLDEIEALPFCCADDILAHGAEMVCISQQEISRIVSLPTSGTTSAQRKRIWFSGQDLERTVEFFSIGMQYICSSGDRAAVFFPTNENGVSDLLCRALAKIGVIASAHGPVTDISAAVRAAEAADILVGIPSQLRAIALAAPRLSVKAVLLSADYVPETLRAAISNIWHCPVITHYGLTESAYGCAVECSPKSEMHIRHDELYIEIIDPVSKKVLPAGEFGEVVITTLLRQAMPLIRYRTGDIAALTNSVCVCGSTLPRLCNIKGRLSVLKNEPNIHQLDELFFACDEIIDYTAQCDDSGLSIAVYPETAIPKAQALFSQRFPANTATFSAGRPFYTTGTAKRRIKEQGSERA